MDALGGMALVSQAGELEIPARPSSLTPAWLTSALRDAGVLDAGDAIEALEVQVIGADRGIGGQVARLWPRAVGRSADAVPSTLIAKFPSAVEQTRAGNRFLRFPQRETAFYLELAPLLPLRTPRCYLAAVDPEGDEFVLLLEDLGGWAPGDDLEGATPSMLQTAVLELANLHASMWRSPLLEALGWMPHIEDRAGAWQRMYSRAWTEANARASVDPAAASLLSLLPEETHALTARIDADGGRAAISRLAASPATLLHGDVRLDNLFFASTGPEAEPIGEADAPLAVIDWSNAMRGPGPYDLAYLFAVATEPEQRRALEDGLLLEYHARLLERGVEGYSLEQCRDDYRLSFVEPLMRMFFLLLRGFTDAGGDRAYRVLARIARHCAIAAHDLEAGALLQA